MENMEQPEVIQGSNENFGKFKDAESLMKAYSNLQSEFTKKSQKLAMLESEINKEKTEQERLTLLDEEIEKFVTKYESVKPFTSALKDTLTKDSNLKLEDEALKILSQNYKSPEFYAQDSEFLNNYIFSNKEIRDNIVKEYLSSITHNSPIKYERGGGAISLTPPKQPSTISEAGKLAKSIIKHK